MIDPASLPVAWANYLSILGFVFLLGLVWMIPKQVVLREAATPSWWRDIRLWATGLISLQVVLYLTFT